MQTTIKVKMNARKHQSNKKVVSEYENEVSLNDTQNNFTIDEEIKDDFIAVSLDGLHEAINRVSDSGELGIKGCLEYLRGARDLIDEEIEKRTPTIPEVAPELWVNRDKSLKENPYEFALRVYRDCHAVLTTGIVRKLDKSLSVAMDRHNAKHGKPEDEFYIPSKQEEAVSIPENVTWDMVMQSASAQTRKLLRAYNTQKIKQKRLSNTS